MVKFKHQRKPPEIEEEIGRAFLELSKRLYWGRNKEVKESLLKETKQHFREAADYYERAGNLKKAEALYRITGKIEEELNPYHKARIYETARAQYLHQKRLEKRVTAAVTIVGFLGGIFFLSSTITGNAIGSQAISNWIGAALLVVGLIAGFFWIKSRKK